jgi:hypothetical protein
MQDNYSGVHPLLSALIRLHPRSSLSDYTQQKARLAMRPYPRSILPEME